MHTGICSWSYKRILIRLLAYISLIYLKLRLQSLKYILKIDSFIYLNQLKEQPCLMETFITAVELEENENSGLDLVRAQIINTLNGSENIFSTRVSSYLVSWGEGIRGRFFYRSYFWILLDCFCKLQSLKFSLFKKTLR